MTNSNFQIGQKLFRVNSYYWFGMVYVVIETTNDKSLCQIEGSKSKPKWIKNEQLSETQKQKAAFD
jgi:hypothetical protein